MSLSSTTKRNLAAVLVITVIFTLILLVAVVTSNEDEKVNKIQPVEIVDNSSSSGTYFLLFIFFILFAVIGGFLFYKFISGLSKKKHEVNSFELEKVIANILNSHFKTNGIVLDTSVGHNGNMYIDRFGDELLVAFRSEGVQYRADLSNGNITGVGHQNNRDYIFDAIDNKVVESLVVSRRPEHQFDVDRLLKALGKYMTKEEIDKIYNGVE